jgi:hypothetical protein
MHSAHRLSVASAVTMVRGVAVLGVGALQGNACIGIAQRSKPGSALGRAGRGCVCAQMFQITKRAATLLLYCGNEVLHESNTRVHLG